MPIALGTGRTGMDWGGSGRRIIETAPSCSWAGASQSKIGGQQREMLPTPRDGRHFSPQQSFLDPAPSNTGRAHTHRWGLLDWRQRRLAFQSLTYCTFQLKSRTHRYTYMTLFSACKDLALAQHGPVKMVVDRKWRRDSFSLGHCFVGCGSKHYATSRALPVLLLT